MSKKRNFNVSQRQVGKGDDRLPCFFKIFKLSTEFPSFNAVTNYGESDQVNIKCLL